MEEKQNNEIIKKLQLLKKEYDKIMLGDLTFYEFVDLYIKEQTLRKIDSPYESIELKE